MNLTEEQTQALKIFFSAKPKNAVMIVTGGPGTGKTTLIEHLYSPVLNMKHLIVTKTWCAASHIRSATGRETIVLDKIDFSQELTEKYQNCILIIDEASMVSVDSTAPLLHSLKPIKLVIVGDERQLTCQDGCSLLSTMIAASKENGGKFPLVRLTKNLRQQGGETALMKNIMGIGREGWDGPLLDPSFQVRKFKTADEALKAAADDFSEGCQMIAFTNKTVDSLNDMTKGKDVDRVMCTKNIENPKTGEMKVVNGMIGKRSEGRIVYRNEHVDKKGRTGNFATDPRPARCLTTHKLQGSEFNETGQLVMTWFKGGIPAELTYTAMSRFKHKVIVYGESRVLDAAFSAPFSPLKINEDVVAMLKERASLM